MKSASRIVLLLAAGWIVGGCGGEGGGGGGGAEPVLAGPDTALISISTQPLQAAGWSHNTPSISGDGRYVAFTSAAANLVPGDTNGWTDVFVRDTLAETTTLVSADLSGVSGNHFSNEPSITPDGRYVAFFSKASNLTPNDVNGYGDVFVRDLLAGTTTLVSLGHSGAQGNGASGSPSITPDGRFVAFVSSATNLVPESSPGASQIYVRDLIAGTIVLASVDSTGAPGDDHSFLPKVSDDGRFVSFGSWASSLVPPGVTISEHVYVRDTVAGTTTCLSEGGTNTILETSISSDGRYAAFATMSPLVSGDTNGQSDIFIWDGLSGSLERLLASPGIQGNGSSFSPSLSPDGRYVAFSSYATNLVAGDTNGVNDVFVRDRLTGSTTRVSRSSLGVQGNGYSVQPEISADGECVAYLSSATNLEPGDTNGENDVFWSHRAQGTTHRVSVGTIRGPGDLDSVRPSISADGGRVAFESDATTLTAGDSNGVRDIFVRDRAAGFTVRVSLGAAGVQANGESTEASMSADGRYVAFTSNASNLVAGDTNARLDVFVRDLQTETTERVSVTPTGLQGNDHSFRPAISANGRYVAFVSYASNLAAGDTNGYPDIFVRDRVGGTTLPASVNSSGVFGNFGNADPSITPDGRFVAFASNSTNLVMGDTNGTQDIFVRDLTAGTTVRASVDPAGAQADGPSFSPSLSADGRFVAFGSAATNLVAGDANGAEDCFVRDLASGTTERISVGSSGAENDKLSAYPAISADGRFVAFMSSGTALVASDTNATSDIFLRDRTAGETIRISVDPSGLQANGGSDRPSLSADGRFAAFQSSATNLYPGDPNGRIDVFVRGPLR